MMRLTTKRGNILPIALIAFAIVGFLLMVDYSVSGGKWPWSVDNTNKVTQSTTNTAANVNADSNTNTIMNVNVSTNTNTNTPEILPTGVKRYTSTKLGVTFTYLVDEGGTIQEIGDRIYVGGSKNNPTDGQSVQVFLKDKSDTLAQAITKRFLSGLSVKDCFITSLSIDGITETQSAAIIDWPLTDPDNHPFGDNSKCPKNYQKTNGFRYFWMDSAHPDTLLFFSIGQYAINGLNDNYKTTWQQTLRVTEANPTADWKTYTNDELGIQFKYPPSWGVVSIKKIDSTMNVNQTGALVESGKAVQINFADNSGRWMSGVWMQASSSDFKQFMSPSYNGGEDLTRGCSDPGVIGANSFCTLRTIAGMSTIDSFTFESPECSPHYIREVRLNLTRSDYTGLRIASNYSSKVDCVSSDAINNQTKLTELTNYLDRSSMDATRLQRLVDFDTLLSTFTFTK